MEKAKGWILLRPEFTPLNMDALRCIKRATVVPVHQSHIPLIDKVEFVSAYPER